MKSTATYTLFISQLISIRRRAIEEWLSTTSHAAVTYVHHDFQQPIRHALEQFWKENIASDARQSGWKSYLEAGSPGESGRAVRSYFKTWKREIFGKDWIFDFFVAFGWVDAEMIACLNDSCIQRAREMDDNMDPASSRVTDFERLSARGRAREVGFGMPPVEGMTRTLSEAAQARLDAKEMQEELWAAEAHDLAENGPGRWTDDQNNRWYERKGVVERAWQKASDLSFAAGHSFTDRYGQRQEIAKESIVARAVRFYFASPREHSWQHVNAWKKQYGGRERPKEKTGPAPKRFRR